MPETAATLAQIRSNQEGQATVYIRGEGLRIEEIAEVAWWGASAKLSPEGEVRARIAQSREWVRRAAETGTAVYGVNTLFGGMADHVVTREDAAELQRNLIWSHKTGCGAALPRAEVRAAILLRANSLARGISGVRLEVIERLLAFLNAGATPQVREFGSIGASGDLVPLAYIAGAITGLDRAYLVEHGGELLPAPVVLARLGLTPLPLEAKEGLALINGTSAMTGMAALCVERAMRLVAVAVTAQALLLQALRATVQSFHAFIHDAKPHGGQGAAAAAMRYLLEGSGLIAGDLDHQLEHREGDLLQDRYSIRCLPQFLGPLLDSLGTIKKQVEVEANSVTDNPLIDAAGDNVYHCGNFLGQYIGTAMDQLRYQIGLAAKHLDVQVAVTVAPEFNRGLAPSLVGNRERQVNVGLKALQLTSNSIMPMLGFYGQSLADRFPTHAEQYNQNINSLGYGSANLTRRALDLFELQAAIALLFAVQAVELRARAEYGHCDAGKVLSPACVPVYAAVRAAVGRPASGERPLVHDDDEQFLDEYIERVRAALEPGGGIHLATADLGAHLYGADA